MVLCGCLGGLGDFILSNLASSDVARLLQTCFKGSIVAKGQGAVAPHVGVLH